MRISAGHERTELRASRKQACRFAVDQFHAIRFGNINAADALQLQQLAFHHHLGEANEKVQYMEITFTHSDLKGLHVQPIAR